MGRRFRTLEEPTGRGVLRKADGTQSWPVPYRLTVMIEEHQAGDIWIDGRRRIEGVAGVDWMTAVAAMDEAGGRGHELVLELEDGRWFNCFMSNSNGRLVARTDNALYPAGSK